MYDNVIPEGDKQFNLCAPEGLQVVEKVSETPCSRERTSVTQLKNR